MQKRLTPAIKNEIKSLNRMGYTVYEIAKKLDLLEVKVVNILYPNK